MESEGRLEVALELLTQVEAQNHPLVKSLIFLGSKENGYAIAGDQQRKSIFRDIFPDGCPREHIEKYSKLYNLNPIITEFCDFSYLAGSCSYPDLNK